MGYREQGSGGGGIPGTVITRWCGTGVRGWEKEREERKGWKGRCLGVWQVSQREENRTLSNCHTTIH